MTNGYHSSPPSKRGRNLKGVEKAPPSSPEMGAFGEQPGETSHAESVTALTKDKIARIFAWA